VKICPDDGVKVDTSSYHCSVVRRMALDAIDPSLALGFYCRDKAEFEDLCNRASELAKESNGAPMFTVAQTRSRSMKLTSGLSFGKLSLDAQDSTSGDTANVDVASTSEDDWQIL
jgi:cysteine protease ATG4